METSVNLMENVVSTYTIYAKRANHHCSSNRGLEEDRGDLEGPFQRDERE
jgi:hypothetical protein